MFKKMSLKRGIKKCKKEIAHIEQKRSRSQAALVEAILTNTIPSDEDTVYFNKYTAEIEVKRNELHDLEIRLQHL